MIESEACNIIFK